MQRTTFPVLPPQRWAGASAPIKRPREIACFSYDDAHEYHPDACSLKYYYTPRVGADLCGGFERFEKVNDSTDEHLDSLLRRLREVEQEEGRKTEADVVTWRGMMTKLMSSPWSDRDGFEMNATLYQGTIFIEENHEYKARSQARQASQQSRPGMPSQDMMSYWGYKFETLSVLPDTWDATSRDYIENREHMTVNNASQYCSIVSTGIGNTRLVIGGEVDAIWDSKPQPEEHDPHPPINWVELKTSVDPRTDREMAAFERKLMKFWVQSFLLGVPKIIVGFRDQQGVLLRVEELDTAKIPGTVKRRGNSWDGNVCVNFVASLLEFLKATITTDGVWRIRRAERSPVVEVFQIEEAGHGAILSDEFINWRIKLSLGAEKPVPGDSNVPSESEEI